MLVHLFIFFEKLNLHFQGISTPAAVQERCANLSILLCSQRHFIKFNAIQYMWCECTLKLYLSKTQFESFVLSDEQNRILQMSKWLHFLHTVKKQRCTWEQRPCSLSSGLSESNGSHLLLLLLIESSKQRGEGQSRTACVNRNIQPGLGSSPHVYPHRKQIHIVAYREQEPKKRRIGPGLCKTIICYFKKNKKIFTISLKSVYGQNVRSC